MPLFSRAVHSKIDKARWPTNAVVVHSTIPALVGYISYMGNSMFGGYRSPRSMAVRLTTRAVQVVGQGLALQVDVRLVVACRRCSTGVVRHLRLDLSGHGVERLLDVRRRER